MHSRVALCVCVLVVEVIKESDNGVQWFDTRTLEPGCLGLSPSLSAVWPWTSDRLSLCLFPPL